MIVREPKTLDLATYGFFGMGALAITLGVMDFALSCRVEKGK
jgi:hypothetical protein